jgi:hypothetical protein
MFWLLLAISPLLPKGFHPYHWISLVHSYTHCSCQVFLMANRATSSLILYAMNMLSLLSTAIPSGAKSIIERES